VGGSVCPAVLERASRTTHSEVDAKSSAQSTVTPSRTRQRDREPITPDQAAAAANDIVESLVTSWRNSGLPAMALAESLIGAGLVMVTRERGPQAAAAILKEFT